MALKVAFEADSFLITLNKVSFINSHFSQSEIDSIDGSKRKKIVVKNLIKVFIRKEN